MNHLDLTGHVFFDAVDSSRQFWIEARYHWTRVDLALSWQLNSGQPGSDYGGSAGTAHLAGAGEVFLLTGGFVDRHAKSPRAAALPRHASRSTIDEQRRGVLEALAQPLDERRAHGTVDDAVIE